MASAMRCFTGAALAAAAMYWFDPRSGRRRRARLRDQVLSAGRHARGALDVSARDLGHRLQGMAAEARHLIGEREVDDAVLVERVRSCIGRAVSHPGAIEVSAERGRVTLGGHVLAQEYGQLLRAVRSVRGVRHVEDQLGVHASARGVSALQGGRPRHLPRFELLQENWSPAARLLMSTAGSALLVLGLRHRSLLGTLGAAAGGTFLTRSMTNLPLKRLAGVTGRRGIDIHKSIHVNAPVEQVFETLAHYENFPLFMRNVRNVKLHPDGRSRWTVAGPGGISVEWDAVTTQFEPDRLLAWRTVRNAAIRHAGMIKLEPEEGGTRVDIQLSYNPPAGAFGHAVAKLFSADPKSELDEDMVRLKSFLETGKQPRDAAVQRAAKHAPAQTPLDVGQPVH